MPTLNLGRVGFVNKGTWLISTAYKINDTVTYLGGTYACLIANTGQTPIFGGTIYWQEWVANDVVHKSGDETITGKKTVTDNLIFGGTLQRIQGDFSNAVISLRTLFQTRTIDTGSTIGVIPNGTGTSSAVQIYNRSDTLNTASVSFQVGDAGCIIASNKVGTGITQPVSIAVDAVEVLKVGTDKSTQFIGRGVYGYGTGSGGTVTQATSKGTAVTLNQPSGAITMNNASLGATTKVFFSLSNTFITQNSKIELSIQGPSIAGNTYKVWDSYVSNGTASIGLENFSAGALSEAVVINFKVISGAIA